VSATRVESNIASDGADLLTTGIWSIVQSCLLNGCGQFRIDHAGLNYRPAIFQIDFQNAIQAIQRNYHSVSMRQ
jgi:hypothetical protein